MERQHMFYFIGELLLSPCDRKKKEVLRRTMSSAGFNWRIFIAMGSNHLVLQTIYRRLCESDLLEYLPPDIHLHLKNVYDLNCQRNNEIMQQVAAINSLLNSHNIVPLYMKGVGNILDGLYKDMGERLMHDIDILVPTGQWRSTAELFLQNGYRGMTVYKPEIENRLKHYPPLFKPGTGIMVEIHDLPVEKEYLKVLDASQIWEAKKLNSENGNCYIMSDHHKVIHNFVHAQLVHHGHAYARVYLRNLFDLYLLSLRDDAGKTLGALKHHASEAKAYLRLMHNIFYPETNERQKLTVMSHLFLWRHAINLRSRTISLITYFLALLFRSYIITPLRALSDKNLRRSLPEKLFSRDWYRRHYRSLTRIYRTKAA